MRIDRRLVLIGVMLIVLSMTMATQYAVTKTGYTYSIVHPSNADIRFIGMDNSTDNIRLLRVNGTNASGDNDIYLYFGNISVNSNVTYTAAFGIVNEEPFKVNITHINVSMSGSGVDYMQVWVHGDPNLTAENDGTSVFLYDQGANQGNYGSSTCVWQLGAGDNDRTTIETTGGKTQWDTRANVQNTSYTTVAQNQTDDYCWFQVSINAPKHANPSLAYNGEIWIHTQANTHEPQ